ncbi:DUF2071 domain-containing protein [Hyalangium rubrum]|uniref:DUF2071 domain-containing protein n=1 Tax=Hyalangium rubrum TaxID=3103134 RepID=A0ABU5HD81_9BACT|nr:DUF2071 domain-containing protein [Hyalangium sp. s54d21]MDY7230065.1 DUF2071 domain-containing protein [Hyalangium sp. s54d21]
MTMPTPHELAVLVALSMEPLGLKRAALLWRLEGSGVAREAGERALVALAGRGLVTEQVGVLLPTPEGHAVLREVHAALERSQDVSPSTAGMEECPSVPWLTQVQTVWVEALSLNYAVTPHVLKKLLPAPLEPELHRGTAWVQVLMSSLREMRPQGLTGLVGFNFYQVSYRAAVRYRNAEGRWRRGGYFVRSETNDPLMRRIGNTLIEFKFHEFGEADMVMAREDERLTFAVDPGAASPGGRLVGVLDTRPLPGAPLGSVWPSLESLHEPLVECYDAFGVADGYVYVLTIDRGPWNASFVRPVELYCEYMQDGALKGHSRLDSVLHLRDCPYRWRPLRRERIPGSG